MGKGGSSQNSSSTNTTNIDKRMVVDGSSIGISSDTSTVNVNNTVTDLGAVTAALDTVRASDARTGQSFEKMLDTQGNFTGQLLDTQDRFTGRLFDAQGDMMGVGKTMFTEAIWANDKVLGRALDAQSEVTGRLFNAQGDMMAAGRDMVSQAISSNADATAQVFGAGKSLFAKAFDVIDRNASLVEQASNNAGKAYATAQELNKTADNRYLVTVGLAVVGLAAVAMFGKKL